MRQQFFNPAGLVRGQPGEHILEVDGMVAGLRPNWLGVLRELACGALNQPALRLTLAWK